MGVLPGRKRTHPVQQYLHTLREQMQTELSGGADTMFALLRQTEAEREGRPIVKQVKGPVAVLFTSARNSGLNDGNRRLFDRFRRILTHFRDFPAITRMIAVFKK